MDFTAFDKSKIDEYAKRAKEQWGKTEAYKEFEQKSSGRSDKEMAQILDGLMQIFKEFGAMMDEKPESETVQAHVKKLQDYLTAHFYQCTPDILSSLGQMYSSGGEFTQNIDSAAKKGCGEFTGKAIKIYCCNRK